MADNIEYGTTGKPHPYHIVEPSIWPMLSAFAAGLLAMGAIFFMHDVEWAGLHLGYKGLVLGVLAVVACMFFWWRDVIYEAVIEKAHSKVAQIGFRYGMMLFILSEIMFFVAFFWAFFNASLFPVGGIWPPEGISMVNPLDLPLMMTLILLLSGCTVTWAHAAVLEGDNDSFSLALALTVALGVMFMGFQIYEYSHLAHHFFGFTDGIFATTFYMATGFHGFHVFVGTVFLFVCWKRAKAKHFTKESHFGFEAAAWYWHFVDVVWLFLFIAIYYWGSGDAVAH
jgi:cytochrome c oxidase subunit III